MQDYALRNRNHAVPSSKVCRRQGAAFIISAILRNPNRLSKLPFGPWKSYAKEIFEPASCQVTVDGMRLPGD